MRPAIPPWSSMVLPVAIGLGLLVRALPVVSDPFPLGDGGLFLTMAEDLRAAGYALPLTSSYNGGIPFAYPPLGLYLLALWPGDLYLAERVIPLVLSVAMIPGVWLLTRSLAGRDAADAASLAFALIPTSWALLGGDVPRAMWLVLGLLSTWQAVESVRRPSAARAAAAGLLAGLACLTHPAALPVMAVTLLLVWAFTSSAGRKWQVGLAMAAPTAVLAAAWLVLVSMRFGVEILIEAASAHGSAPLALRVLAFGVHRGPIDPFTGLALVGVAFAIARREIFLPLWTAALLVIPGSELRVLAVPVAALVGIAWSRFRHMSVGSVSSRAVRGVGLAVATVALVSAVIAPYTTLPFGALDRSSREAMYWVEANTPPSAVFAVVTASDDAAVEWFPALAKRTSVTTYQGLEWVGAKAFNDRVSVGRELRDCTEVSCVDGLEADFLYLGPDCCHALRASVPRDARVYDAAAITIIDLGALD